MDSHDSSNAARRGIASLPPWIKLLVWVAAVVVLAALVQSAAWLFGLDFDILSQSKAGRAVLLVLALGSLLALMAADIRPAAEYGLIVSDRWLRQWCRGFLTGLVTYAGYCSLAVALGALEWSWQSQVVAERWAGAVMAALTAVPLAITQQIIFSGYLLGLFAARYGRVLGVLMVSALFALSSRLDYLPSILSPDQFPLLVGMFLISALLSLLRLRHQTVLVPAGLLAGWIVVRRLLYKGHLLELGDPLAAWWLAPVADPRQAPVMWLVLAAAIAAMALRKRPAAEPIDSHQAIATSFKRVAPLSHMSMLAPLDVWLPRLWSSRMAVGWKYLPRLVAILAVSAFNTLLCLPERLLLPLAFGRRKVPDPVFIVGVHRSGTTHLQNLLSLDPALVTPVAYQVMNPFGFLISGWLFMPLLAAFSPWRRPMDAVRFHAFAPNEEEIAIAGMCRLSPYWGQTFPRQTPEYDRYIHPADLTPAELRGWKRHYLRFLRALTFWSPRRPLLKSPYNTARVALLRQMFPRARFIHIYRQPYAVYRSNMHLAREGHCMYQLHDPDERTSYSARFLDNYRAMEEAFYGDAEQIPAGCLAEVCFEELERDPIGQIRRLYAELELDWNPRFERWLVRYLESLDGYTKNRFQPLPEPTRQLIHQALRPLFDRWGYDVNGNRQSGDGRQAA